MEHAYDVTVTWTGNTGEGTASYRSYTRDHTIAAEGRPQLLGSSDATFRGDPTRWNPELFLLAALEECHLLSYLHVCVTEGVVVTSYADHAHGSMTTYPDGSGRFTGVVLRPRVTVAEPGMLGAAAKAHHRASELCFIANSVSFPVEHEPVVTVGR